MIPPGHKVAMREVRRGERSGATGTVIGYAHEGHRPGDHVLSRNFSQWRGAGSRFMRRAPDAALLTTVPESERRTPSWASDEDECKVGTELRRHPGIVNCSSLRRSPRR